MTTVTKGAIYFNPLSGARRISALELREAGKEYGLELVEIGPELRIDLDVKHRLSLGQRLFVAAGGDGTINSVLQCLVQKAALGVIPVGTWNHFALDLGVPQEWRAALAVAAKGATRHIDVGRVNDRYFLNNISLGLYPEMVEHREKLRKVQSKWKAYGIASYAAFQKFPHVSLAIELPHRFETIKTHLFMVSVNPYDLGQVGMLAPRARLDTGRLGVYWLPHMPKLQFIRTLARYISGRMITGDTFRSMQTTHLKVQASRFTLRLGMDGELVEMPAPLSVTVVPQALAVRVPR